MLDKTYTSFPSVLLTDFLSLFWSPYMGFILENLVGYPFLFVSRDKI